MDRNSLSKIYFVKNRKLLIGKKHTNQSQSTYWHLIEIIEVIFQVK
jgi:hypothetical protein